MKRNKNGFFITLLVILAMLYSCGSEPPQKSDMDIKPAASPKVTLTVLNPQGHVKKDKVLAPRLDTLEGKKIAMYLSATPDQVYAGKGAELYDMLEKMFKEKYPNTQVVHYAELPMKFMPENEVVDAIIAEKPDGVVVGFGG
ncbi:MAG: hypothetical protein GX654_00375 [Desulfatiglans sp.]|nr:hypothetical protein [Desulfatiglans sp.]